MYLKSTIAYSKFKEHEIMKGKVYLVGAGPGDYKLMTLKGLECIRK